MKSSLHCSNRGAVYVEFLVVVMPFLTFFLGLTQLGLIYGAKLLVGHAAARAARAAIVILPDDHEDANYAGVPLNQVFASAGDPFLFSDAPPGGRTEAIRRAARLTLAPVSPSIESFVADSLADALGDNSALSFVAGLIGWTDTAVAVSFPDGEGGYRTTFDPRGPVTVKVSFLYRCSVPLARRLMCSSGDELFSGQGAGFLGESSALGLAAGAMGWSLIVLEAERTLPNQGR